MKATTTKYKQFSILLFKIPLFSHENFILTTKRVRILVSGIILQIFLFG